MNFSVHTQQYQCTFEIHMMIHERILCTNKQISQSDRACVTFQAHKPEVLDLELIHPEPHPTPRYLTMGPPEVEQAEYKWKRKQHVDIWTSTQQYFLRGLLQPSTTHKSVTESSVGQITVPTKLTKNTGRNSRDRPIESLQRHLGRSPKSHYIDISNTNLTLICGQVGCQEYWEHR